MMLLLGVLVFAMAIEVTMFTIRPTWQHKRIRTVLIALTVPLHAFAAAGLVFLYFSVITSVFALLMVYRIFNLLRIAENRMNGAYLRSATRRTSATLLLAQVACVGVWAFDQQLQPGTDFWVSLLIAIQLAVASILFANTIRTLRRTKTQDVEPLGAHATNDLPSVTVAIPARNETDELEKCLYQLVKSDYPKLEILVLDDCSQTKRTPAIIRDFAHAGVRFLKGAEPDGSWTAKNNAYAQLAAEANGELILFCGVDIRFEQHTVRQLVSSLLHRNKRMLSVLPLRQNRGLVEASLVQSARYMWELTPLRKLFKRPPVLSSCWLIYRRDLRRYGGFAAVKRSITPEAHFARRAVDDGDSYSFVRATQGLGLTTIKPHKAQYQTALRVRYPSLHRRPEMVAAISLAETLCILAAFVFAGLASLGLMEPVLGSMAILAATLYTATYVSVAYATRVNHVLIALFWAVPVAIADILTMHRSMWRYEFSDVIWKGRNVCLPVMHVTSHLPEFKDSVSSR